MSELPPPPAPEAIAEARLRSARLAADFATVFGVGSKRTSAQASVLDHLYKCAGEDGNSYQFGKTDGLSAIGAGIHRDGARSVLRVIDRQLLIATRQRAAKPKKTVKR